MFPAETQGRDITFNGRKLRVVAMRDISVRRKAEMELRESANKILAIFSAIGDGITVADLQGRILESNHAAFRLHGFENKEEFLDIDIAQLVAGTDRERMLHDGRTIMQSGGAGVFEYTLRRNDGSLFDGELRLTRLDNAQKGSPGIIAVTRDISRRKRAEEALRNSEGRLRQAMYVAQLGIWDWDITTDKTTWQGQMFNIYGVSPEQFTGNGADYIAFTREDYRHAQAENISFAFEHGVTEEQLLSGIDIPLDSKELCIVQSDGTEVYTLGNAIAILDEKGIATRMLGVTMDITARKRAEQALQEAEARYRMLVEQMPTVMYVDAPDEAGTSTYVSPQVETMLGYPLAEWEQDSYFWHKHIHPDDYEHAVRVIPTVLSHGHADAEYRMLARDGQAVWVRDECVLIRDAAGRPFFVQGFLVDVTERKRAEEERRQLEARMQQAQKLESLGILAGGIAHDFNNLLTSMLGYASLALMELPAESVACPMLREIELAARRAADLTQQLLAYSGRSKFVIQVLQLDMLVQEMAKLLGTVVSKKATLRLDLAPAAIEADATQIRQIVMNLITNASDALEGQPGVITVRTGVRYADAALLHSPYLQEALPAGDYAYVEVEDNGCGMTEDTLARIFDPFFTTKFTGRGLGLAAVLGIAKGHKGTIKVISAVGQGTVFQAFFPCVRAAAGEAARVDPRRAAVQGHGTVLVVEDEDMVRSFTRRVLESAGFQVREAADGRAGLELFGQHVRDIVAVVLDLTMPRMDGREVLQHMRHLAPNVPVLVMSGYSDLEISARFAGLGASGFIQKPFHPRDLIALVSRMVS